MFFRDLETTDDVKIFNYQKAMVNFLCFLASLKPPSGMHWPVAGLPDYGAWGSNARDLLPTGEAPTLLGKGSMQTAPRPLNTPKQQGLEKGE